MLLTQCAACAAPLGLSSGKKCGRCSTRYCGAACQVQHWKEGGHEQLCKPIKKAGGAEQYHANKKYAEAVSVAVEECADDTKGQTCYICTEGAKRRHAPDEGLVRMCACRGTSGFAHISCLAEQAKILFMEAVDNNLSDKVKNETWKRWHKCYLCEQDHHGIVRCALGWACWKTCLERAVWPKNGDQIRRMAMNVLGNGLQTARRDEDALSVRIAEFDMIKRHGSSREKALAVLHNLASSYEAVGRFEDALGIQLNVYRNTLKYYGKQHEDSLNAAYNLAITLRRLGQFQEARALLRESISVAQRVRGPCDVRTLKMRWDYANAVYMDPAATLDDLREAVTTLEETTRTGRRVMGRSHPLVLRFEQDLRNAQGALRARETGDLNSLREAIEAMTAGDA